MQIVVYRSKCIACGLCTNTSPDIFEMSDGCAEAVTGEIPNRLRKEVESLIGECPTEAMKRI